MKRMRHSPEQIIHNLRDADRMLSEGKEIEAVCHALSQARAASQQPTDTCYEIVSPVQD